MRRSISPGTTPVILVGGVAADAMATVTLGLQWDLPRAVVVAHRIDLGRQVVTRTVSDATGLLDTAELDVEHACVSCAIREDIVPTLERLCADGRWGAVVALLPVAAECAQVCRVVAWAPQRVQHVHIAASVVALDAASIRDDLLGNDLLADRGLHTADDDRRGVGEVACSMVEYADAVVMVGEVDTQARELVETLARPTALLVGEGEHLDAATLAAGLHDHAMSEEWVAAVRRSRIDRGSRRSHVWLRDLYADRPFHPERLRANLDGLGGGPRRTRGCFWLPTRPLQVCSWEGAGGQVGVGHAGAWRRSEPVTRIVAVGLDDGADEVSAAFEAALLSAAEAERRGQIWEVDSDGYEPWLGPVGRVS